MHLKHGCILESKDEGQIFSSARKIYGKKASFVPSPTGAKQFVACKFQASVAEEQD